MKQMDTFSKPHQKESKGNAAELETLKITVKRLQEELKMERGNTLILKTQYENALKHEQQMTSNLRIQLEKMVSTTSAEVNRLDEKKDEMHQLT
jgi:hypothetical protein